MIINSKQLSTVLQESDMSKNSKLLSAVSDDSEMSMLSGPKQLSTISHECKVGTHTKQFPHVLNHCNTLGDLKYSFSKPVSNESNSDLLSKICVQNLTDSGVCDYWTEGEESCSSLNLKRNSQQLLNLSGPICTTSSNIRDDSKTSSVFSDISREEIVARRKLKVAALRKTKKLEKQQKTRSTPDFVLDSLPNQNSHPDKNILLAEDFPDLSSALNNKKKFKNNQFENASEIENNKGSKRNKGVEKSWKPKVKDPISIDIGQALQFKPEKVKVVSKKVDPTAQRNVVQGNILDSDNPQLKKGKVRPNKQRKATKLKKQILSERNERQIQNEQVKNGECSRLPMTVENSEYALLNEENSVVVDQLRTDLSVPDLSDEISSLLVTCVKINSDKESNSNNGKDLINQHQLKKLESSKTIHSNRFRDYCTNCLTEEVISSVCTLLEKLAYFQDRTFARDPIRAQAKRRYVAGINQTKKYLIVKKVKLLVIAPDLEKNSGEGGLDNIVENFKNEADSQGVPYVFGPKRSRLAKAVLKKALVSCVAVLSYEGAEELFSRVLEALNDAKTKYQVLIGITSINADKNYTEELFKPETVDYISADNVTSSLLAVLKGDLSPADKLLNAIHKSDWSKMET